MKEPLDELDDGSYQLMMDIQTGQMVNPSRRARAWMLLGLVTVVLGGLVGLLLANGNRTSESTGVQQAPLSTFTGRTPQPLSRGPQDMTKGFIGSSPSQQDTLPVYTPPEEPGSANIQSSSDRGIGHRTKGLSAFPRITDAPKPASAP